MEENATPLLNTCDSRDVEPIMMSLPYPEVKVREKNLAYANLLSIDYCGSVSEMSAIMQYINNHNRLSCDQCPLSKTILGIAMAEMIHLKKLGELIFLLGGNIDFVAKYRDGRQKMWTPQFVAIHDNAREMLLSNIKGEQDAIEQYKIHIRMIEDDCVTAVLARIIKDEEYHILLLQTLMKEL